MNNSMWETLTKNLHHLFFRIQFEDYTKITLLIKVCTLLMLIKCQFDVQKNSNKNTLNINVYNTSAHVPWKFSLDGMWIQT